MLLAYLACKNFSLKHMSRKVQEVVSAGISEDVDDDDRRLYECARKYEIMLKQLDPLMEMLDNCGPTSKRRKTRNGSASGARAGVSSSKPTSNKELVQTITRFLHELRADPADPECSKST